MWESWTIKKVERQRIDAIKLWCWRRLLRVPWTIRRSTQSILKISPECSLEGRMLKLKLQYFGHLMHRAYSLEKTLMLGKIVGRKRMIQQRMTCLDGITQQWTWVRTSSRSWWWTGKPSMLQSMGLLRVRQDWATEQQKVTVIAQNSSQGGVLSQKNQAPFICVTLGKLLCLIYLICKWR